MQNPPTLKLMLAPKLQRRSTAGEGGGERIRTAVQTYSPKAFYMLIPELVVG